MNAGFTVCILSHFLAIYEHHNWPPTGLDAAAWGLSRQFCLRARLGGGGSLGCPLDDVYIHQVPSKKYFTLILKSLNITIKSA